MSCFLNGKCCFVFHLKSSKILEALDTLCYPHLMCLRKCIYTGQLWSCEELEKVGEVTGIPVTSDSLESEVVMTAWQSGAVQPEIL